MDIIILLASVSYIYIYLARWFVFFFYIIFFFFAADGWCSVYWFFCRVCCACGVCVCVSCVLSLALSAQTKLIPESEGGKEMSGNLNFLSYTNTNHNGGTILSVQYNLFFFKFLYRKIGELAGQPNDSTVSHILWTHNAHTTLGTLQNRTEDRKK